MRGETIEQIFHSAVEVFAHSGFERAKIDDVARHAGVAKGTIYYHFKGKEELFVALMRDGMEKMTEQIHRQMGREPDPLRRLRALLQAQVEYLYEHGTFAKLLLSESWGSVERQQEFRAKIRELVELIEEVLIQGAEEGSFRPQMSHHDTAVAMFGAISVSVLQDLFSPERTGTREERVAGLVANLEKLFVDGVVVSKGKT
ncbi:transcriptional regulator, TetR family [Melghirimyces thermohalophilus]|uniref:Transcriptional regulator, TetR family n=1 Tax=Melghirimyces thermohalophilus TaxID=1236220 RepID=A0A1G6QXD9_9BACL|nr:TetR/AcrR family transcriptional regulator [Melghirimyces thermohalophilus]SDC96326.1 transcriptional regulator, TetR family [Melghirimyces thermohalophilus]